MILARRWASFGTSIFTEMTELARRHDAVNLAQGFPDFPGPAALVRAIEAHARSSHLQYAPSAGEPRLREAVARIVEASTGVARDPGTEVTITTGATEAIYATVNALVDPGDRVVVLEPFYDSYAQAIANAGGVLVPVRLHPPEGAVGPWSIDWAQLDAATAAGFRLLILNSPHNPTGKVFDDAELARIAGAVVASDAVAMCDEVYEDLVYDHARHRSLSALEAVRDRVVRISSAAKTFGFTGLKVGWATAAPELTAAVRLVHQAMVFCTPPLLQTALAEVLEDGAWLGEYRDQLRRDYQGKRDLLRGALGDAGFAVADTAGAYFLMASFAGDDGDVAVARRLVEERGVAAIPPSVFYATPPARLPWLRFAFCKRDETLRRAAERLTSSGSRASRAAP